MMRRRSLLLAAASLVLLCSGALAGTSVAAGAPSNARVWTAEQARLPMARFDGSTVVIENVRDWRYAANGPVSQAWTTRIYDLDNIDSVWLVLSPFGEKWRGPAHAFLSFGFDDGTFVGVSVEARKELGESYSLLKGATRRFEIAYVVADERDLIQLRANVWGDEVYVYPIRAPREKVRALFVDMLERANELAAQPEYYNTITNNCTTAILEHANRVSSTPIPYGWQVLAPGYVDELAIELGLVDDAASVEDGRTRYLVNERSLRFADDPDYSLRIRSPL